MALKYESDLRGDRASPDSTVNLGDQGLSDGDDIGTFLSTFLDDNTEVVIPDGHYYWDSSGLAGGYSNAILRGASPDGVELEITGTRFYTASYASGGGVFEIRDLNITGKMPADEDKFRVEARHDNSHMLLHNVNLVDGALSNADGGGGGGYYVGKYHSGMITFHECESWYACDNGLYASVPGNPSSDGEMGQIDVLGGRYGNNNISSVRLGGPDSRVMHTCLVNDDWAPANDGVHNQRLLRIRAPEARNQYIYNCDFIMTNGSGGGHVVQYYGADNASGEIRECRFYNETDTVIGRDKTGNGTFTFYDCHFRGSGSMTNEFPESNSCYGSSCDMADCTGVDGGGGGDPSGQIGPLGGGDGYTRTVSRSDADFEVSTESELFNAFDNASSGDIIYVTADIEQTTVRTDPGEGEPIPAGVTLASDRGINGSQGSAIYSTQESMGGDWNDKMLKAQDNVRITGLRIEGTLIDSRFAPRDGEPYPVLSGVNAAGTGVEIDNCSIEGFRDSGITSQNDNLIRYCNLAGHGQMGLGYGVNVSGGNPLIEYCTFNENRHSIAASVGDYTVENSWFGPIGYSHCIDHHNAGGEDVIFRNITVEFTHDHNGDWKDAIEFRSGDNIPNEFVVDSCWFHHPESRAISVEGENWRDVADVATNNHFGETEPSSDIGSPRGTFEPPEGGIDPEGWGHVDSFDFASPYHELAVDPSNTQVALARRDGQLTIHDADTGNVDQALSVSNDVLRTVDYSPSGDLIAVAGDESAWVYSTSDWSLEKHLDTLTTSTRNIRFAPDGDHLAVDQTGGNPKVFRTGTWQEDRSIPGHEEGQKPLAWSPDSIHLIVGDDTGSATVYRSGDWAEIQTITADVGSIQSAAFDPNGRRFALGGTLGNVEVYETGSWALDSIMSQAGDTIRSVAFSPNSAWVVYGSNDEGVYLHQTGSYEYLGSLLQATNNVPGLMFSSNSSNLYYGGMDATVHKHDTPEKAIGVTGRNARAAANAQPGSISVSGDVPSGGELFPAGEEAIYRHFFEGTLDKPPSLYLGLYNSSLDRLLESDTLDDITTEPEGSSYSRQTVGLNDNGFEVGKTIQGNWFADGASVIFDLTDSTGNVDSWFLVIEYERMQDSSVQQHIFATGQMGDAYDLSNVNLIEVQGYGLFSN